MRLKSLLLNSCLIFLLSFIFLATPASADENFKISLVSTYKTADNGKPRVVQEFTLTNRKPDVYATEYSLETSTTNIANIFVLDGKKELTPKIVTTDEKTSISFNFPDNVVGEGKSRKFSISFESPDSVISTGSVTEFYVPRLANRSSFENYVVQIELPKDQGLPTRSSPKNYDRQQKGSSNIFTYSELADQGVVAIFGQEQTYNFSLRYFLENPTTSSGIMQIALPPDNRTQRVVYNSLEPPAKTLERDEDGNWIATYSVNSQKSLEVVATGTVNTYISPLDGVPDSPPLPQHTLPDTYWESDNPKIIELAQKYQTPKEIYDYVTKTLDYDYSKLSSPSKRLGAVAILDTPHQAICQEFTDLFIAIARSAKIPARRATGFAFTNNSRLRPFNLDQEILHAWPEYYSTEKKAWIAVDPTWGKTTDGLDFFDDFDVNHIVFAYNGVSSTQPFGAGSYKPKNDKTRDVVVKVSDKVSLPEPSIEVSLHPDIFYSLPVGQKFRLDLLNKTGKAEYNLPFLTTAQDSATSENIKTSTLSTLDYLLPFQERSVSLALEPTTWWQSGVSKIDLQVGIISNSYEQAYGPIQPRFVIPATLGVSLATAAIISWGVLVRLSRKKSALRWQS